MFNYMKNDWVTTKFERIEENLFLFLGKAFSHIKKKRNRCLDYLMQMIDLLCRIVCLNEKYWVKWLKKKMLVWRRQFQLRPN
jgi:hypothetical protein